MIHITDCVLTWCKATMLFFLRTLSLYVKSSSSLSSLLCLHCLFTLLITLRFLFIMVGRLSLPPSPYVISWSFACSFPLLQVTQLTKVFKWFRFLFWRVFLLEILALFFVFVLFNYLGLHFFKKIFFVRDLHLVLQLHLVHDNSTSWGVFLLLIWYNLQCGF